MAGLAALALVLAGCGDTLESFGGPTMGSTYSIKYVRGASAPDVQTAKAAVEAILAEVDRQMSTYRDDSLVSRFNALPAQSCMELPLPMLELLRYGGELSEQSQGAFDMTVEPLMNLWGFGPQARVEKVPSAEQIAAVRRDVGHRHLRIDGQRLCKDAAVQLDFDSIAAGYTVDAVGERLKELGVRSYLAEITGELKAEGSSITEGIGQGRITANLEDAKVDHAFQIQDDRAVTEGFDPGGDLALEDEEPDPRDVRVSDQFEDNMEGTVSATDVDLYSSITRAMGVADVFGNPIDFRDYIDVFTV